MGIESGSVARRRLGSGEPRPRVTSGEGDGVGTAQAMLEATEKLLASRSLDELTVVDIITEAGVSRATFYLYFESKHAAVAALAHEVVQDIFMAGWAPLLARAEPLTERVLVGLWTDTIGKWQEHRPVLIAAAQGWRRQHGGSFELWGSSFREYSRTVRDYIESARGAGQAPGGLDAAALAAALVWMSENMMYLNLTGDAPELSDSEKLAAILASVWAQATDAAGSLFVLAHLTLPPAGRHGIPRTDNDDKTGGCGPVPACQARFRAHSCRPKDALGPLDGGQGRSGLEHGDHAG